jgi:predicted amidohydrolase YtcJ
VGVDGRADDGRLTGVVEGSAVYKVLSCAPSPPTEELTAGLQRASAAYAALGVGSIREALIEPGEWPAYARAAASRELMVRARPLIRLPDGRSVDEGVELLDELASLDRFDDDWLRLWGLKIVFDGGVEGAALEEPYTDNPSFSGHLNWDLGTMVTVGTAALQRGWRIGTHAVGDRAVRLLLDAYERIQTTVGRALAAGSLVVEHAMLATPDSKLERSASASLSPSSTPFCGTWAAKY